MAVINSSPYYRADIDGLRAIAVIAVALFHAEISCPGGFVGVDVFFVISGFLITRLILTEWQKDQFSLLNFWNRRIRRIFPILLVVLLAVLGIGFIFLWPSDLVILAKSVRSMGLMVSNIHFWLDTGYFAEQAEFKQLLHTWSLSIEEQFYILYPLLLMFLFTPFGKKKWVILLALLGLISLIICVVCTFMFPRSAFYLLPARAWELVIGGLLAAQPFTKPRHRWMSESLSLAGLAAILVAVIQLDQSTPFPGVAALLPVVGTALIIYGNTHHSTLLRKMLSIKPVVFVGLISYSFYLWHWPLLIFGRILFWGQWWIDLIALGVSLILSMVTWRWVEQPFRKRSWDHRRVYGVAFAASLSLVALTAVVVNSGGFPGRSRSFELMQRESRFEVSDQDLFAGNTVRMGNEPTGTEDQTDFIVIGDSHASAVLPTIQQLAEEYHLHGVSLVRAGRSPFGNHDNYAGINQAIKKTIQDVKPRMVILIARWTSLFGADSAVLDFDRNLQILKELVGVCRQVNAEVRIMGQVPWHVIPRPVVRWRQIRAKQNPDKYAPPQIQLSDYQDASRFVRLAFRALEIEGVRVLDLSPYCFNAEGKIKWPDSQHLLYWDDNHFTQYGGNAMLAPMFQVLFSSEL